MGRNTKVIDWREELDRVFTIQPRNAVANPNNWIDRPELTEFVQKLFPVGLSVCLDGPTGVGKSSIGESGLYKICSEQKIWDGYVVIQCEVGMTWGDICWQFVQTVLNVGVLPKEGYLVDAVRFGFQNHLASVGIDIRRKDFGEVQKLRAYVYGWGVYELAKFAHDGRTIICLDDAEKLDSAMFQKLADLCKKFSGTLPGKLVMIGMGDIFRRILDNDLSLAGRFEELVLGGLADQARYQYWNFLCDGFARLGFKEPRRLLSTGLPNFEKNKIEVDQCIASICDATGGIPKLLNLLGVHVIAHSAGPTGERRIVSPNDIMEATSRFVRDQIDINSKSHRGLVQVLRDSLEARLVIAGLFVSGISRACSVDSLIETIMRGRAGNAAGLSPESVITAVNLLVEKKILVRTGKSNETLYALDPPVVHSFGVAIRMRDRYGISQDYLSEVGQLSLPLLG